MMVGHVREMTISVTGGTTFVMAGHVREIT